mgnify:CR=1 FL=1
MLISGMHHSRSHQLLADVPRCRFPADARVFQPDNLGLLAMRKWLARQSRGVRIAAWVGALAAFPFAIYLGIVLGGNMGAGLAAGVGGVILLPIGIALGFAVVFTPIVLTGAFVGVLLGVAIERGFRILRRNPR